MPPHISIVVLFFIILNQTGTDPDRFKVQQRERTKHIDVPDLP